jgi:hypothetical protein
MINENDTLDKEYINGEGTPVEIYTKGAIWGFSIFFSPIFGGVLLMQNLKDLGLKKEAHFILHLSIIYTLVTIFLTTYFLAPNGMATIVINIIGALVLTQYFFPKYIPNELEYKHKTIWKPLIISLIITLPFIIAMIINAKYGAS